MKNWEIADIFEKIALILEMKNENIFKIKAYQKASENIASLGEDIEGLKKEDKLSEIPGVGVALREKIIEYLDKGRIDYFEELKKEFPEGMLALVDVPSVGPKKAKLFYEEFKIKSVEELKKAATSGKLRGLPGIQEKTIQNILRGIHVIEERHERMNLGFACEIAERFIQELKKLSDVKKIAAAGSLRRMKETIRDIDILIVSSNPEKVMDVFVGLPYVKSINAKGATKSSVFTKDNFQVDLRVVEPESFGAALLYFTGCKNFNVKLRQLAIRKDMKVSEYGIFSVKNGKERFLAGDTEENVFKVLGFPYIPPEVREDFCETELFSLKKSPKLLELSDIKGDLQMHSTYSDGQNSIADMARAARAKGYEYIAITDHSPSLVIAGGVSVSDLRKKKKEIDQLNGKLKDFRILYGTEVEIDADGKLDYNEKILSEFDFVIAAVHSGFKQKEEQLTRRIIAACKNKYVHAIAHPTGVHIGKRKPYDVDLKEICKAAVDTNTFLEINASPQRLDLNSQNVYFARSQGVKFVVNTDAHAAAHLDFMRFGVAVARRGWLTKENVMNTLPLDALLKELLKKRKK